MEIGSRLENLELVQVALQAALQRLEVDSDDAREIGRAVREAVVNAMRHGNGVDPDKQVEVDLALDGSEAVIRVRDPGSGFEPHGVPDPLELDDLHTDPGRGILAMRESMDRMEYSFHPQRGTELTLRRQLALRREGSDRLEEEE